MEWKTRVTELLGCRYPILQGAVERIGNWKFAAAVAEAGAHGTITASISKTPEKLLEDIRRCKDSTGGSFGVNLSIGLCPQVEEMLEVCIAEKVPVETSVYKPAALSRRIKESGLKWIHKAARVKDAVHAQEEGADAIILVGLEGAGIKNPEQLPTMTTIVWGRRHITVPLIAAGGIGDAHGFLGALGMGADGIMMVSAFMATQECPIEEKYKQAIIRLSPDNADFRQRVMTARAINRDAPRQPDTSETDWSRAVSFSAGVIDHIPTVKELVESIVHGAEGILEGWEFLKNR